MGYNLTENLFGYTLVQDILVESATTSVTFSGLNYTAADDLLLVSDVNNTAAGANYYININGNNTQTNYYTQLIEASGSSVTSSRLNLPLIASIETSSYGLNIVKLKLTNSNYFVSQSNSIRKYGTSTNVLNEFNATSTFTATTITSLTVTAGTTNAIGIGSRFRLYKLNATKVADITVGTATTSVDITGLNITKDSEYMLVSDVAYSDINNPFYSLFANGSNTATSYWTQGLQVNGTSIYAYRSNDAVVIGLTPNTRYFSITNIKLTNNGSIIFQHNTSSFYGTSSVRLNNINTTSTFTATSITQLTISTTTSNAIGVGSRFQLYRMKG